MFEHLLLALAIAGLIVLFVRVRSLQAENASIQSRIKIVDAENFRLGKVVAPLKVVPGELVDMLAKARSENLVSDVVVSDAAAILNERLAFRSPELLDLKRRLQREFLTIGKLGPVAAAEVKRVEQELLSAKSNGWPAVLIAEMEYGNDPRLGSVKQVGFEMWTCTGPIKQIVDYFQEQGLQIRVQSELRYTNHPRGGGLGYQVLVVVP